MYTLRMLFLQYPWWYTYWLPDLPAWTDDNISMFNFTGYRSLHVLIPLSTHSTRFNCRRHLNVWKSQLTSLLIIQYVRVNITCTYSTWLLTHFIYFILALSFYSYPRCLLNKYNQSCEPYLEKPCSVIIDNTTMLVSWFSIIGISVKAMYE